LSRRSIQTHHKAKGNRLLYHIYELNHAAMAPMRAFADFGQMYFTDSSNPITGTAYGRTMAAGFELFERSTRRYGKPEFDITSVEIEGEITAVEEVVAWKKPFCRLLHFAKTKKALAKSQPTLLLIAPMSGHYATLLRGTVQTMLRDHDVYITDWTDARQVPLSQGTFDLDDYIDYIIEMLQELGPDTHVMAVCQPSVPVMAAVALMSEDKDPCAPASMTLMGGPIDTRINPTAVNNLAMKKGTDWFARNVIVKVPFPQSGMMRNVYPGFLQLTGFMSMNLDRHMSAHQNLFTHLIEGDGDSAEKHREFYDEYMSVMDLTAEYYLQTIETVFVQHALPMGTMTYRGRSINPAAIENTALMTVEGERDDISGVGQTEAAHKLCPNIPESRKIHYLQPGIGHYGVFNGKRFNAEIAPRITRFIKNNPACLKPAKAVARKKAK
jgi:poly(3-hydroxybutyrate) depolymerase